MGFRAYFIALIIGVVLGAGGLYIAQDPTLTGLSIQPLLDQAPNLEIPSVGTGSSGAQINTYFCPQDHCALQLSDFIDRAQSSVHVMVYSFTKEDIADALVEAGARGVEVRVIMDSTQASNKYAKDEYLAERGIPVKTVNLSGWHIMHHKVTIIDGKAVSTGSFNYTNNGDRGNAENLIIINDPVQAQSFEEEFQKYWFYTE